MPLYDKYYSALIFDTNHFMEVGVMLKSQQLFVCRISKAIQDAGLKKLDRYVKEGHDSANYFVSPYEGGADLDRAAGAIAGQLGTQARYAQYGQIILTSMVDF